MDLTSAPSGRSHQPLPIDVRLGFPQSFSVVLGNALYFFTMYVDIDANLLSDSTIDIFALPEERAFLVARVDKQNSDSTRTTIFVRKLTPEQEYEVENISLFFPQQVVARMNLNGQGDFGSVVLGGIASRWA